MDILEEEEVVIYISIQEHKDMEMEVMGYMVEEEMVHMMEILKFRV